MNPAATDICKPIKTVIWSVNSKSAGVRMSWTHAADTHRYSRQSWDRSKCQVDIQPEPKRCWSHSCYRNLSFSSGIWCRNRLQPLCVFITGSKTEKPALIAFASALATDAKGWILCASGKDARGAHRKSSVSDRPEMKNRVESSIQRPPHLLRRCREMPQTERCLTPPQVPPVGGANVQRQDKSEVGAI